MTSGWFVVVPLKAANVGKSRLGRDEDLVRAIGLDTVAAASAATSVERVIVVTPDAATARIAATMTGVAVVTEHEPRGLNAAIDLGIATAPADAPRAALLGDVPALHPDELDAALRAAADVARGVVPDADGTGSTLVTARAGETWQSAFGADSAARHRALGMTTLEVPAHAGLRRDVDSEAQLHAACALGLGPRSAAALGTAVA